MIPDGRWLVWRMGFSGEERLRAVVEVPADRFACEIVGFLAVCPVRSRQLNGIPWTAILARITLVALNKRACSGIIFASAICPVLSFSPLSVS
jgi:hypothetical protein